MRRLCFTAAAALLVATPAMAQTPSADQMTPPLSAPAASAPTSPIEPAPPAPATIRIPAGTAVQVEITEALNSETSQQEQLFSLRLAEPIVIDGREIVPAGALGGGEVIDAHPSAFGGRQGRLIISGRFLEIGGQRARIRAMQITAAGEDRSRATVAAAIVVGIPAILIQGGEVHIPVGTRATARLAADVDVSLEPPTQVATVEAAIETAEQSIEGENQQ